jgi:hypothetical protein
VLAFACPVCRSLIYFENSVCVTCGTALGFDRSQRRMVALESTPAGLRSVASAEPGAAALRPCANNSAAACNWLTPVDGPEICASCLLTRTRPSNTDGPAMISFARAEAAKRRLVFQLDDLRLPVVSRHEDPEHGIAFDLLSSASGSVTTGHQSGVITIDLAEGEDGHREALRARLAEPYRTLLGHFRHEIGHWYWDVLVAPTPVLQGFRPTFGDEREDYAAALQRHYAYDPPPDWQQRYVSIYASAHPWEDWAETFAHYLHIRDTMQTADAFGIWVGGPDAPVVPPPEVPLAALPNAGARDFDDILASWLPLTYALNQVNRSMGKDDLYPFVLSPTAVEKLRFVHGVVSAAPVGATTTSS